MNSQEKSSGSRPPRRRPRQAAGTRPPRHPAGSRGGSRGLHRHRLPGGEQEKGRPDLPTKPASGCRTRSGQLGYRPNAMAKTLVSGSSRFIGLVADAIATTPFAGQIIHGAQDEAWKHGYALLIANTEGNTRAGDRTRSP